MRKETHRCLQERTGSCSGCPIIEIAILGMRWRGNDLGTMHSHIAAHYCPDDVHPQPLEKFINKNASHGLGQRRYENTQFDHQRVPLRPKPYKGKPHSKMSKSKTGRFFVQTD